MTPQFDLGAFLGPAEEAGEGFYLDVGEVKLLPSLIGAFWEQHIAKVLEAFESQLGHTLSDLENRIQSTDHWSTYSEAGTLQASDRLRAGVGALAFRERWIGFKKASQQEPHSQGASGISALRSCLDDLESRLKTVTDPEKIFPLVKRAILDLDLSFLTVAHGFIPELKWETFDEVMQSASGARRTVEVSYYDPRPGVSSDTALKVHLHSWSKQTSADVVMLSEFMDGYSQEVAPDDPVIVRWETVKTLAQEAGLKAYECCALAHVRNRVFSFRSDFIQARYAEIKERRADMEEALRQRYKALERVKKDFQASSKKQPRAKKKRETEWAQIRANYDAFFAERKVKREALEQWDNAYSWTDEFILRKYLHKPTYDAYEKAAKEYETAKKKLNHAVSRFSLDLLSIRQTYVRGREVVQAIIEEWKKQRRQDRKLNVLREQLPEMLHHISPNGQAPYQDVVELIQMIDDQRRPDESWFDVLPARLSGEDRRLHTYISGGTGSGKSELIKVLVHSYVTRPDSGSVVVIDPHGKLAREIARWKEFVGNDRLIYIQPVGLKSGHTPVINPFEMPVIDDLHERNLAVSVMAQQLTRVIEEVAREGGGGSLTGYMTVIARHCATALLHLGGTLDDLQRFMMDGQNVDLVERAKRIASRKSREFFRSRFHHEAYGPTRNGLYNRFEILLSNDAFYHATVGESTLDLKAALDEGKVVVFNLAGMGTDATPAFGRFLIAYIQGLALQRDPNRENTPVHLFADECQNFITDAVETILNEGRKFGLHLTLVQQQVGYGMSDELKRTVLGNCNIVLAGSNDPRSQNDIAKRTGASLEDLGQLGQGRFLLYVDSRKATTPAYLVQVSSHLIDDKNAMSVDEWEEVKTRQLERYYRPIDDSPGHVGEEPFMYRPKF